MPRPRVGPLVRLYVDEDVCRCLAPLLRARGFSARSVYEERREGFTDEDQLRRASHLRTPLLTHNRRDFLALDAQYRRTGAEHHGIVVVDQIALGGYRRLQRLVTRTMRLLRALEGHDTRNEVYRLNRQVASARLR